MNRKSDPLSLTEPEDLRLIRKHMDYKVKLRMMASFNYQESQPSPA